MTSSPRPTMHPSARSRRAALSSLRMTATAWASLALLGAGCSSSTPTETTGSRCLQDVCGPSDGGPFDGADMRREAGSTHGSSSTSHPGACSFQGKPLPSGSSVTAFEAATVPAGSTCESQSRECKDGTLSGTYSHASCSVAAPTTPAFYVSPSGDDANPGTLEQPFLTLPKAQAAMQASLSIKTTFLRAGTYAVQASSASSSCDFESGTTAVELGSADDGETWSFYAPDGYGSAIIDGGSTSSSTGVACAFAASGAMNLTFTGLQLQRFRDSVIWAYSSPNLVVSDNAIHDLTVAAYNVAAVAVHSSSGVTVKNNYIHDVAYIGVGAWGGGMSDTTLSGNVVLNSCTATAQPGGNDMDGGDCGAVYLWDESHASTNIAVTNNYVRDVNVSSDGAGDYTGCCATGIYLDDGTSNVTVSGNVVTGTKSQCFVIHGGNNDSYTGNLCDLDDSKYQRIITYQWDQLMLPMSGNSIEDNIIVSSSMSAGTGYSDDGTPTAPTIKNNAYYNYVGSSIDSSGSNGSDANPTYEDPTISCWDPSIAASSPVYAAPVSFVQLTGGWGPPGFVLPQTGTPPSWPHGC